MEMKMNDGNAKSRNERIEADRSLGIEWCSDEIYRLHGVINDLKTKLLFAIADLCSTCCEPSCDGCRWAKVKDEVDVP